jgi:iron-sulfur cluster assembly protein
MIVSKVLYRDKVAAENKDSMRALPGQVPAEGDAIEPAPADVIAITAAAAKEIKRQKEKRGTPDAFIRIGIRGGGCTGFSYVFDFHDGEPRAKDRVFSDHGVSIVVDHKSFEYLKGTTLDFETSIMGYGFKFHNPNATGSCGCGASVQF